MQRKAKEDMGQSKSKDRDIKDYKTSKVLKKREKKQSKRREVKKRQQGCCASPSKYPIHLTPTFFMSVFYHLSFLHLQLPPVRFLE
jgi:hypothetical protein